MHKTEGLKRQALKGMFSLMYITNSLLKNKRMLLYECGKISSRLHTSKPVSFLHRIYKMKGLLKAYNHIGKNHDYDVDMQWQWLTGFSSCIKKSVHMAYLVMRWFCVWLQSSACYYLFTQTHSVKPKPIGTMGSKLFWSSDSIFEISIQKKYWEVSIFGMIRK